MASLSAFSLLQCLLAMVLLLQSVPVTGHFPPGTDSGLEHIRDTAFRSDTGMGHRQAIQRSLHTADKHPALEKHDNEGMESPLTRRGPMRRRILQEAGKSFLSNNSNCQPQPPLDASQLLTWQPQEGRYLLMLCFRNQISNLMRCMRNHVLLAGLLNRTLLIPDWIPFSDRNPIWPPDWQQPDNPNHRIFDLRVLWDLEQATKCLGEGRIMRLDEFVSKEGRKVVIDAIHCWYGNKEVCNFHTEAWPNCPANSPLKPNPAFFKDRLPQVDLGAISNHTTASAACMREVADVSSVVHAYTSQNAHVNNSRVLVAGELVNMKFTDSDGKILKSQDSLGPDPFARTPDCPNRLLLQPAHEIFDHAANVIETLFNGQPFLALHWRRGDYLWFCQRCVFTGKCTYAAPQAATCVTRIMQSLNLERVYIATNAAAREVIAFKRYLVRLMGPHVRVYSSPILRGGAAWLKHLAERGVDVKSQKALLGVTLDKVICAHSAVFVGSVESTFTMDIQRMRLGLGKASSCDTLLCKSEGEWDKTTIFKETRKTHLSWA